MILFYLKAGSFFRIIEVLILSGVKFLLAPPLSFKLGFSYPKTILITTIGGLLGVIFFYFLSDMIMRLFRREWPKIKYYFSKKGLELEPAVVKIPKKKSQPKKKFSRKNKLIVLTRKKYGLWGIAALTPLLLSIPLGTFLAIKYYRNKKNVFLSLALSVVCWSVIMSSIYAIFKMKPF
jgi:hypothetical protein